MLAIDHHYLKETLLQLLKTPSTAGLTRTNLTFVEHELQAMGFTTRWTRRGALQAYNAAEEPARRAVAAHVDTLGMVVRELKSNGRVGVLPIGSWSSRMAEGARVDIHTAEAGMFRGSVMPLKSSVHASSKAVDEQPVNWDQLEIRVDQKLQDKAWLESLGIQVGDLVSVDAQPEIMDSGFIVSRFLDDLGGVACLLATLKALPLQDIACASLFYFSNYEEQGHGASITLPPTVEELVGVDIAIVAPGQNSEEDKLSVVLLDNSGPFDPVLTRKLEQLAKQENLSYVRDVFRFYFSDCAAALQAGNDVRHALIGFGTDASHSYERTHIDALIGICQLLGAYLKSPL
jgi:peptidase M42 family hydrolase